MSTNTKRIPARHSITVEAFHRMGDAGILREDDRVELIEGEMIDMAPIGSRHAAVVAELTRRFVLGVGTQARVWVQNPIQLEATSEPQPDLALLRPREDRYATALPRVEDVLLIVEVADATLAYDRDVKLALYAKHGIPEVWLVDLEGRRLHVFLSPAEGTYREGRMQERLTIVAPASLPDCPLDLSDLIP